MHYTLVITCEHAGNELPEDYRLLFSGAESIVDTHEGWDQGAWEVACELASLFNQQAIGGHVSRLLIELNRSINNPELFSRFSKSLSSEQQNELLTKIYFPYRDNIEQLIKTSTKPVLHLSIHTFISVFKNEVREVDIGLLFDPERKQENNFCLDLKTHLRNVFPGLTIRDNEPYKGIDDGFTTYLRTVFADQDYLGIEIEINQKFLSALGPIKDGIAKSLRKTLRMSA